VLQIDSAKEKAHTAVELRGGPRRAINSVLRKASRLELHGTVHTVPRREVGLDARDRPLFSGGDRWIDAACRALAEAGCLVPRSTRSCRAVRLNQSPRPFRTSPYLVSPLDTTALAAVFRLLLGKARRCGVQAGQGMPGRSTGPFRPRHGGAPPPAPGPHFCPQAKRENHERKWVSINRRDGAS